MPESSCPHLPIKCARIKLRDFRDADLATFTKYRANPDIARYQGWDEFCMDDARAFFEVLKPLRFGVPGTWYQVAIASLESDEIIGDCVIHFTGDDSVVEIGFTLAPQFHGRGLAHEAISRLVELIFDTLAKQRIIAVTHAHNNAAHRLLARLGFDSKDHDSEDPDPEFLHTLNLDHWRTVQSGRS